MLSTRNILSKLFVSSMEKKFIGIDPMLGEINRLSQRMILLPARSLFFVQEYLNEHKEGLGDEAMFEFGRHKIKRAYGEIGRFFGVFSEKGEKSQNTKSEVSSAKARLSKIIPFRKLGGFHPVMEFGLLFLGLLGWGDFQLKKMDKENKRISARVINSPIASTYLSLHDEKATGPLCHVVRGMSDAAFEILFGTRAKEIVEKRCAAVEGERILEYNGVLRKIPICEIEVH